MLNFNNNFKQPLAFLSKFKKIKSKIKGGVGFSKQGRSLLRRSRASQIYYNNNVISTRFYTKSLFLFTNFSILSKKINNFLINYFTSPRNLNTFSFLNSNLFSINFTDNRSILGSKSKVKPSQLLLYFSPGSQIKYLRDVFSSEHMWVTSVGSKATINFFDRFSGFLNVALTSLKPRLFFFLSRAYPVFKSGSNDFFINNEYFFNATAPLKTNKLKAGDIYNFGQRPKVRGVAMNPVDHPHGGRTKSIKLPKTPWGKVTKLK